jgi:hypothetical protein
MLSFDAGPGGHGDLSLAVPSAAEGLYVTFLKTEELTRPIWAPRIREFRGAVRLKEGLNTFRFAIDSQNPASVGYRLGLDCIGLE